MAGPHTSVSTILDRAGIDHVRVHEQRLLAIYRTDIFNVTTEPESVSTACTLEIECWEAPLPSRGDERSLQDLLKDFAAVFDPDDEF